MNTVLAQCKPLPKVRRAVQACGNCRTRKSGCDGRRPQCGRCKEKATVCVYAAAQRAACACDACRSLKSKCDERRPQCGGCKGRGSICTYPVRRSKRIDKSPYILDALLRLEGTLNGLEAQVRPRIQVQPSNSSNLPNIQPLISESTHFNKPITANLETPSRELEKNSNSCNEIAHFHIPSFITPNPYAVSVTGPRTIGPSSTNTLELSAYPFSNNSLFLPVSRSDTSTIGTGWQNSLTAPISIRDASDQFTPDLASSQNFQIYSSESPSSTGSPNLNNSASTAQYEALYTVCLNQVSSFLCISDADSNYYFCQYPPLNSLICDSELQYNTGAGDHPVQGPSPHILEQRPHILTHGGSMAQSQNCVHSFDLLQSGSIFVKWVCLTCHSGSSQHIFECKHCRLMTCSQCFNKI